MRNIFHRENFYLNTLFGLGYCVGTSLSLELIEAVENELVHRHLAYVVSLFNEEVLSIIGATIIGMIFYQIGFEFLGKKEHYKRVESWWTLASFLVLMAGCEFFMNTIFDRSIWQDFVENIEWTVLEAVLTFCCLKAAYYFWTYRIKSKFGDGSEGLNYKTTEKILKLGSEYIGENKQIENDDYDKSFAVHCNNGIFIGRKAKAKGVKEFLGIPYAKTPIGSLRWQAPEPCDNSKQAYEAICYGKNVPQEVTKWYDLKPETMSEDCLYLNIWTSENSKPDDNKPVIVVLHSTDSSHGTNNDIYLNGDEFVQKHPETIYVNLSYRFGIFGFMDFSKVPGGENYANATNLGLLDQLQALRWIKENIIGFGGNPENITVMGMGGSFSHSLLLPLVHGSNPQIKKIFSFSGSIDFVTSKEKAQELTKKIMDYFDLTNMGDFAKLTTEQLVEAEILFASDINMPILDENLLPLDPYAAYENGACKDINIVLGTNKDECNTLIAVTSKAEQEVISKQLYEVLKTQANNEDMKVLNDFIALEKTTNNLDFSMSILEAWNYINFHIPAIKICQAITKGAGLARYYFWNCKSPLQYLGASSCIEHAFLFGHKKLQREFGIVIDSHVSDVFSQMLVNFMQKENPSLEKGNVKHVDEIVWPAFTHAEMPIMNFTLKDIKLMDNFLIPSKSKLEALHKYKQDFGILPAMKIIQKNDL